MLSSLLLILGFLLSAVVVIVYVKAVKMGAKKAEEEISQLQFQLLSTVTVLLFLGSIAAKLQGW